MSQMGPDEPQSPDEPEGATPGEPADVEGTIAAAGGLRGTVSAAGGLRGGASQFSQFFNPRPLPPDPLPSVTTGPSTVFVEVGAAQEQAAISRDGVQVPVIQINPAGLEGSLQNTVALPARVVTQSIAPGVSVAKGTTVDITLAEPLKLTVGVLQNPFQPLAAQNLADVYKNLIRDNASVQSVLARNANAATLSQADQSTLTQALAGNGTQVTTTPGQTIDAAFDTLQAAFTFGT